MASTQVLCQRVSPAQVLAATKLVRITEFYRVFLSLGQSAAAALAQRDLCNPYGYVKPKLTTFSPHITGHLSIHSNTIALHSVQQHHQQQLQQQQRQASPFHSLPMANR